MRTWRRWWESLSWLGRWGPLLAGGLYGLVLHLTAGAGLSHVVLLGLVGGLHYAGPVTHPWRRLVLPFVLMLLVYDSQRVWLEAVRGEVHVADLHAAELRCFGLQDGGERVIPAQWWQTRTYAWLDLICGVAYLAYVPVFLAAVWWWRRAGAPVERVMWVFFWVNVLGFAGYVIYPAAPPWYVELYGLGPAQLDAAPAAAGAARFDALIGRPIFANYYAQSSNVFGAMPSLHAGVPFLALLYALRLRSLRVLTGVLAATTAFAAVYLNHHYVLDVLAGQALALTVFAVAELAISRRGRPAGP